MSKSVQDWRKRPVEPRIQHLVRSLNETGLVTTYASCEGHFLHNSDPYVAFKCTPETAEALAGGLDALWRSGRLNHFWRISGLFDAGHKLCFDLRADALAHERRLPVIFWRYVVRRKQIDADLVLLSEVLPEALCHANGRLKHPIHFQDDEQDDQAAHQPQQPLQDSTRRQSHGVFGSALWARPLIVGRNGISANATFLQYRHTKLPSNCTAFPIAQNTGEAE